MRIPTSQFPATLNDQLQSILSQEMTYQKQSATGLAVTTPSDDPVAYQRALGLQSQLASNQSYLDTITNLQSVADYNHQAMTDLQTALSKASEIATKVNTTYSDSDLKSMATEIDGIISQVADIANRKKDGSYLFGGTQNQQSVNPTTYAYNATSTSLTTAQISSSSTMTTGLLAGSSSTTPSATSGFLYDSATSTDTIQALINLRDHLNAGQSMVTTIQNTDLPAISNSLDLASEYVGKTAANLEVLSMNKTTLTNLIQSDKTSISSVTSASMTDAVTQLAQLQTNYQAALQAGSKILSMSLMNYMS